MPDRDQTSEPDARTLADLSALADGTLEEARAAEVRGLIARSPGLAERYERELRAVDALQATRFDRAPARLRARINADRRVPERPRRGLLYGGAVAGAAAAAALALALLLPGGTAGGPSVSQAATMALRGPVTAAPAPDSTQPAKLNRDVQEVYFPNWASSFGWTATGQRSDTMDGRQAVTVYYTNRAGSRVAYTILGAPAMKWPGTQTAWVGGTELQSFRMHGMTVVTWRRGNHTCVLSGPGVPAGVLMKLAA